MEVSRTDCTIDIESDVENVSDQRSITIHEQTAITANSVEVVSCVLEESLIKSWKGKPLSQMNSLLKAECQLELIKLEPGRSHTILFKVKVKVTY